MREISTDSFQDVLFRQDEYYHDPNQFGYVTIAQKDKGWIEKHFLVKELPERIRLLNKTRDSHLTQAEFFRHRRLTVNFLRISLSFIDLDLYHLPEYQDKPPEEKTTAALLFCDDNKIPRPNLILYSGQGLYLKWFYDKPIPARALPKWNTVQRALYELLKPLKADIQATDITTTLRMVNTVNTKTKEYARVMWDNGHSWNFDDLADEVLPLSGEQYRERKAQQAEDKAKRKDNRIRNASDREVKKAIRRTNSFSIQTLAWSRLFDLQHIVIPMQFTGGVQKGMREDFLFVGATCVSYLVKDLGQFDKEINEFHRNAVPSLPEKEIRAYTSRIRKNLNQAFLISKNEGNINGFNPFFKEVYDDPRYKLTNESIIQRLDIPYEVQKHCTTIISEKIKQERHRAADEKRNREKGIIEREKYEARRKGELEENIQKALELREKGLSRKQIAEVMGKSRQSIDIYMNFSPKIKC